MDKLRRLLTILCVFAAGATAGILATHLPIASAAGNKSVTVYMGSSTEYVEDAISWIVEDRGILRIRGEHDERVYNCEGWDRIVATSTQ